MLKTKIKKAIATIAIAGLTTATLGSTYAASQIGTATVTGDASFDSNVIWDDTFPGTATGTVEGIVVTAQVLPTLNMAISSGSINLGTLDADIEKSGSLDIEVGTNAANGVTITARSQNGGLTNKSDASIQINSLTTDGIAESYKFSSSANTIDSTVTGFATTGDLTALEVNNNTTEHTIYTTNKPEQNDATNADVTFSVATTANAQTAAGDYEDKITFTVTGNF